MNWYFIRITSDLTNLQNLSELFGTPYLIGKEYSKRQKLYYHILHQSTLTKEELKEKVYDHLPGCPKGIHTLKIDIVGETKEDFDTAATYTVKDGDYIHSDYFEDKIAEYVANSYSKKQPYTQALKDLIEQHTDDEYQNINWRKLKVKIAILRSEYHMEVFKNKIEALVLSIQISMNHNIAEELFSSD